MAYLKISGPETTEMTGFVVIDLDGADAADGIVRSAKKVLVDGARTMARSRTYSWALLERRVSGASAAINVTPEHRAEGIAAFVAEVRDRIGSGELSLDPGKGVSTADLAALDEVDTRDALGRADGAHGTLAAELLAIGVLESVSTAAGTLDGRRFAIEGAGDALGSLVAAIDRRGGRVVALGTGTGTAVAPEGFAADAILGGLSEHGEGLPASLGGDLPPEAVLAADADVLLCGSKMGLLGHAVAAGLDVDVVAPIGVAPVTAKALAVAGRADVLVLPDFLTLLGPLLAFRPDEGASADDLRALAATTASELTSTAAAHAEGAYLGACDAAESFLSTWQDELPFGRPLA